MIPHTNNLDLLTIEDVAERLICSTNIVYRLVRSKALRAFKVAGHWRITEEDYKNFIQKSKSDSSMI